MSGVSSERWSPAQSTVGDLLCWGRRAVSGISFWAAVVLPAGYLPLLALARIEPAVALLVVHAAALLLGHSYGRPA